jgi:hypothetical protein
MRTGYRRSFLLCATLIGVLSARAQEYAFQVLVIKGKVEVNSTQGWQPAKTGARLAVSDELKLLADSYVALRHSGGRPVEVRETGTYKVADLAARVKSGSSLINKYTDFILSKAEEGKPMLATGAVHRGTEGELDVYVPDMKYSSLFSDQLVLGWSPQGEGPYKVTFRNNFDFEVFSTTTNDTLLNVDLSEPKFQNQEVLFASVVSTKTPAVKSKDFLLRRMDAGERAGIEVLLKEMKDPLGEETAVQKYILAGFFEEHKLYYDAASAFLQAITLAPDVTAYRQAYEYFLLRNGMKNPRE